MADTVFVERVDTIYNRDTIKLTKLIPQEVIKIKRDTVYDKQGNEIELAYEKKRYQDTIINGKDSADITIWTSGIDAKVDSVSLLLNKREIIRDRTITITKEKEKTFLDRFHVGLQVGYGLGLKDKQFQPYVGIGASFDF